MAPTIDSETLLYVLGVAFALGTLAFFASEIVFDLSITVTAALLLVTFVAFLIAGISIDRAPLDTIAFAVSGVAYVVFLGYVVSRYRPDPVGVFVLLASSAGLFVGLGYALQENRLTIDRRTARLTILGVAVIGVLLVGADSIGELEYTVEFDDEFVPEETTASGDGTVVFNEQRVGTLSIENPTLFTRAVEPPSLNGCLAGVETDRVDGVGFYYEPRSYQLPDRLGRNEGTTAEIYASVALPENATEPGEPIPIERAESCGVTHSEPTLLVVEDEPDRVLPP
ncbi:hypothetical protein EGH24_11460 [Halonotius terrestris]|uniref:DUF1109 domain-containing protein n=1 Tax=Halonotius terrestris TaxID=2487750 RepID=A0A8J8TBY4_9EURY|nr:hypothetical protein [Halonotius terrestris]TQQ79243.1 hypothetical protein EGH24_11460 [Halonotius terrestris]